MNTIIARFFQCPKRLLLAAAMLLCFISFALMPATALAATQSCGATDVNCVIQFGDQQITNRINDLNKLSAKVTEDHNKLLISDADADALQNDITTNINGLNALKAKL